MILEERLDGVPCDIYVCVVERTTIYLDPALKRQLKEAARKRGVTEAAILREALQRYLGSAPQPELEPVGTTADGGVAHRADEALDELGFGRS